MKKRLIARRFMKNERAGKYLQANAPVHEVYLRLVDVTKIQWRERAQFLAMAAQMTPRILVTAARARGAQKRGGGSPKVKTAVSSATPDRSILPVDEVLPRSPSRLTPGRGWSVALFRRPEGGGSTLAEFSPSG